MSEEDLTNPPKEDSGSSHRVEIPSEVSLPTATIVETPPVPEKEVTEDKPIEQP